MQLFLHTQGRVRIINDSLNPSEFITSEEDFEALEPNYIGLPENAESIYWTPEKSYIKFIDGAMIHGAFDGSIYTAKVAQYAASLPTIWAHVTMSKAALCLSAEPPETMVFNAALKPSQAPDDPNLPVNASWIIRLRNKDGLVCDAFTFTLTDGASGPMTYTPPPGILPQVLYVDESDFASVSVGGQAYQVRLAAPVEFTLYRTL